MSTHAPRHKITWSISGKVIGLEANSPRNVVNMKEEMAAFFVSGSVVVLLPLGEIENYLVEIFSDMCCLVDNASLNCQTNTLARSI